MLTTRDGVKDVFYGFLLCTAFFVEPRLLGPHTAEDEQRFIHADTTFKGAMISVLGESIEDTYVTIVHW